MTPQRKVLVIFDGKRGPTATQRISFSQPFDESHGPVPARIVVERDDREPDQIATAFAALGPDLLVLSRYTSERGADWIRLARKAGVPIIFHVDDDLLAVPPSLGEVKYRAYNSPERLNALRRNIDGCDLLYASTAELGSRFGEHGVRTPIVAGDIYCSVSPDEIGALLGTATGPVIGYMGTSGHSADLAMIMPSVCDVMDIVPGLQFEVFGTIEMPLELARFGGRVRHLPPVADYADFIPYLRSLGWWIGLAPLEDNSFNRCKADTKWVEYSLAGMAVVASDMPVYHRACRGGAGILAGGHTAWRDALLELLSRPRVRIDMVEAAQNKLRESYTHDSLRRQVINVFERAFDVAGSARATRRPREPAFADGEPRPEH